MATPTSAALLMYRTTAGLEVFIAHPGGPYWAKKDDGAWSLPKGLAEPDDEDLLSVARREFEEETGLAPPPSDATVYIDLGEVSLKSRKRVRAWAFEGDWPDERQVRSNTFEIEWPPRSGVRRSFPEIDRVSWVEPALARVKLNAAQIAFVDRLEAALAAA